MELNYRQYSENGVPVLVLHGLFGSLSNWGWHCKQLAQQYAVYGVDLRNHGDSPHSDQLDYQVMAEDVRQLIVRLGLESCCIVGHSMGGKVAMQLALSFPDLIEKLVIVDIAPVSYPEDADGHMNVLAAMDAVKLGEIKSRTQAEVTIEDYIPQEATRKFLLTNLVRNKEGSFEWRLDKDSIRKNYANLRAELIATMSFLKPVLFIKGSLSPYIKPEHEAQIKELFPAASVKLLMDAGHWLHAEKPQALQKILLKFLSS
jgi:esterase|tara:strand:+ start:614 stop:1390 length:777 start_codon:yes stop_codon:yes gene_type:complete